LADGIRTYHLASSRERARGAGGIIRRPRHFLVYRLPDDAHIEIVRVLHDAMDLEQHTPEGYGRAEEDDA
jgi:toxin ParE1/3/4